MNTPKNFDRMTRGLATTTSRRQALKMLGGGLLGGAVAGAGFAVAKDTVAQGAPGGYAQTVTGTIDGQDFVGTLEITRFLRAGSDQIAALGNLLDGAGNFLGTVRMPVTIANATCDVLNLTLGPLDLNLLGLEIHLDVVNLDIVANPAGGLLGQLLCAVANLLNGGGPLQQIIGLLNQILGALGG